MWTLLYIRRFLDIYLKLFIDVTEYAWQAFHKYNALMHNGDNEIVYCANKRVRPSVHNSPN